MKKAVQPDFPAFEAEILKTWESEKTFYIYADCLNWQRNPMNNLFINQVINCFTKF